MSPAMTIALSYKCGWLRRLTLEDTEVSVWGRCNYETLPIGISTHGAKGE